MGVGRLGARRAGAEPRHGSALLGEVGRPLTGRRRLSPGVGALVAAVADRWISAHFAASARRFLPLGLGGQAAASRGAVVGRVSPAQLGGAQVLAAGAAQGAAVVPLGLAMFVLHPGVYLASAGLQAVQAEAGDAHEFHRPLVGVSALAAHPERASGHGYCARPGRAVHGLCARGDGGRRLRGWRRGALRGGRGAAQQQDQPGLTGMALTLALPSSTTTLNFTELHWVRSLSASTCFLRVSRTAL